MTIVPEENLILEQKGLKNKILLTSAFSSLKSHSKMKNKDQ